MIMIENIAMVDHSVCLLYQWWAAHFIQSYQLQFHEWQCKFQKSKRKRWRHGA